MVGSALVRRLKAEGCEILTVDREELDLRDQAAVEASWRREAEFVFLAAARVGGILANARSRPNSSTTIWRSRRTSSMPRTGTASRSYCSSALPASIRSSRRSRSPEDALLTGPLEPTNEWYAVAKIAGMKMCQAYRRQYGCDFISAMPTNLYGPDDNFDLQHSPRHAGADPQVPRGQDAAKAAARRSCGARGTPRREFLHVDDLADASLFLMEHYSTPRSTSTSGTGEDLTIRELAADGQRACRLSTASAVRYVASPTARRKSCSIPRACMRWAGGRRRASRTACARPTPGTSIASSGSRHAVDLRSGAERRRACRLDTAAPVRTISGGSIGRRYLGEAIGPLTNRM